MKTFNIQGQTFTVGKDVIGKSDVVKLSWDIEYMIAVMQWYADGGQIEYIARNDAYDEWRKGELLIWNWDHRLYRAVPKRMKPKYKPYRKGQCEWLCKCVKVIDSPNIADIVTAIDAEDNDNIGVVRIGGHWYNGKQFLARFTWLDGSPCGELA